MTVAAKPAEANTMVSCALVLIAAAISCVLFFYFADRSAIRVPAYDMLDWLQFYDDRVRANDWVGYLWTPANEHRLVFTRALIAIDIRWLGGRGNGFAIFGSLIWIFAVLAAWRVVLTFSKTLTFRIFAGSIVLLILSPTYIVTTISMPAAGAFIQTPSFALFCMTLLDNETNHVRLRSFYRVWALICACLSSFGVACGLLIWPVLIWSAWRAGLGRNWIVAVIGAGLVFVALFLWKMPPKSYQSPLSIQSFIAPIDYGIRFLGLPWSHAVELAWPARAVGLVVLMVGGLVVARASIQREKPPRAQRIGAALILFAFLVAAAAAFGRVNIPGPTPIRYAMFMVLAHLGLFLYALPYLHALWQKGRATSLQWVAVVLAVAWLGHQVAVGEMAVKEASHYNDAWSRFVAGDWTPDMLLYVYPDHERALAGLAYLRRNHIGWTLSP
jgi:hypothetical protein